MEHSNEIKNLLCAECGQLAVNLNQKTNQLKCSKCNNIMNIQIYQKSIEFLYQELIIQALKYSIGQNAGVITHLLNKYYIVYFDKNNEINIAELDQLDKTQKAEVGSIVKITSEQMDTLAYEIMEK